MQLIMVDNMEVSGATSIINFIGGIDSTYWILFGIIGFMLLIILIFTYMSDAFYVTYFGGNDNNLDDYPRYGKSYKNEFQTSFESNCSKLRDSYSKLITAINQNLTRGFALNNEYLKDYLIETIRLIEHDLLEKKNITIAEFDRLDVNKRKVTDRHLFWLELISKQKSIMDSFATKNNLIEKDLRDLYNKGTNKYSYIKSKHSDLLEKHLSYDTRIEFYRKNYFSKIDWMISQAMKSIECGNFTKAFKFKDAYEALLEEVKFILDSPIKFLQKIHDSSYEVKVLEESMSNKTKGSIYYELIQLAQEYDLNPLFEEKVESIIGDRNNYFMTTKWCGDDIIKSTALKVLKARCFTTTNSIRSIIRFNGGERKLDHTHSLSLEDFEGII